MPNRDSVNQTLWRQKLAPLVLNIYFSPGLVPTMLIKYIMAFERELGQTTLVWLDH